MNDDDLIRDAVHELVGAAPPPKPLPMGGSSLGGSYRWLAIAAAAILVVGGIVAIAWSQADDEATPVATTAPAPLPTPPSVTVAPSTPPPTSAATVTVPPTVPNTIETTAPTSTSTTTTTTTTSTSTVPPTPELSNLQAYLIALADGRYDDAARLLNEGGLEPERRADLRPLYTEYGDVADLAARLRSWCENEANCSAPDSTPEDIGGYWLASWAGVTGYFRSGSFEGSPLVHGLPPRRPPAGSLPPCPASDVEAVREADMDGDGAPETIVVTHDAAGTQRTLYLCNTASDIPPLQLVPGASLAIGVLQPAGDPGATLLIGTPGESSTCGATYRMAASAGALLQAGWEGCWGPDTGESIGCRDIGGQPAIVSYRYSFVGGGTLDTSTALDVDVLTLDGAPLDSFTLTLPDQIDEAFQIIEPYCNGLPVITEG